MVIGETKGGVKIRQIADRWLKEAADLRDFAQRQPRSDEREAISRGMKNAADVCEEKARDLLSEFFIEPQPQSGAGDVEECIVCRGISNWAKKNFNATTADKPEIRGTEETTGAERVSPTTKTSSANVRI